MAQILGAQEGRQVLGAAVLRHHVVKVNLRPMQPTKEPRVGPTPFRPLPLAQVARVTSRQSCLGKAPLVKVPLHSKRQS